MIDISDRDAVVLLAQAWLDVIHDQAMAPIDMDIALRKIEHAQRHLLGRDIGRFRLRPGFVRGRRRDTP